MTNPSPDPTAPYRDLLAAIHEALDRPDAAYGEYEKKVVLRGDRATAILGTLDGVVGRSASPSIAAELLRETCESFLKVHYEPAIPAAPDLPDDCIVCGPGCCAPVLGIHTSCPGPAAGATVVSAR